MKYFNVFCLLFLLGSRAFAFDIPERLEFDLKWSGIKAGTAVLETQKNGNGTIKIVSTAKSADWISVFYPVEDNIVSTIELGPLSRSLSYKVLLKEGRHRRNKELTFDHTAKKVVLVDHLSNEKSEFDIPNGILDPLAAFYRVRGMELVVGKSVFVTVFDSKKVAEVEVKVLRKEKLDSPLGELKTIVIKPMMKSEGIFSGKGELIVWLTDDERKVPVLLKSKVAVGSIVAELTHWPY